VIQGKKVLKNILLNMTGGYFEGSTMKSVTNKVLKYIFVGGKE